MKKTRYLIMALIAVMFLAYPAHACKTGGHKPKPHVIHTGKIIDKVCEKDNWKTLFFRKKCICADFEAEIAENTEDHILITWPDKSDYAKKYHVRFYVNGKKEFSDTVDKTVHEYSIPQKPEYDGAKLLFVVSIIPEKRVGFPCVDKMSWTGEVPEPPQTCDMTQTVQLGDMPEALVTQASRPKDGFIYIVGGMKSPGGGDADCSDNIIKYEIATDTTTVLESVLPYAMCPQITSAMAWADNGKLYISPFLGPTIAGGGGEHSCIVEFDPVTQIAQEKACFDTERWDMNVMNGHDGYMYFLGGYRGGGLGDIWRYDPESDALTDTGVYWNIGAQNPSLLDTGDGKAYIWLSSNGEATDFYQFDSSDLSHTLIKSSDEWTGGATWQGADGKVYGLGGTPYWQYFSVYDPATDELTILDLGDHVFPYTSTATMADTDTGYLYSFGGYLGGTFSPQAYRTECLLPEPGPEPLGDILGISGISGSSESRIILASSDGSGTIEVCNSGIAIDNSLRYSDDKTMMTGVVWDGVSDEIFTINADCSDYQQITLNHDPYGSASPRFYGTDKIWFNRNYASGTSEFYEMNLDGSGQTKLTDFHASGTEVKSFDFNEANICYRKQNSSSAGTGRIYCSDTDFNNEIQISEASGINPEISPDGTKVLYSVNGSPGIYTSNADGTGGHQLLNSEASGLSVWSPDGTRIAYSFDGDIYVMNADGTNRVNITNTPDIIERVTDWR